MIKINLTPEEELRSPLWWIPEVAIIVVIYLAASWAVNAQMQGLREKTAELDAQITQIEQSISSLQVKTKRYDNLDSQINDLKSKIDSLKGITVSIINRFRPIIILEHLQTIKPAGVWFDELAIDSKAETLSLKGEALHSLLVSEFITGLKSTAQTETDPSDLRTQVYFDDINLLETKMLGGSGRFKDVLDVRSYSINLKYKDRTRSTNKNNISLNIEPSSAIVNF